MALQFPGRLELVGFPPSATGPANCTAFQVQLLDDQGRPIEPNTSVFLDLDLLNARLFNDAMCSSPFTVSTFRLDGGALSRVAWARVQAGGSTFSVNAGGAHEPAMVSVAFDAGSTCLPPDAGCLAGMNGAAACCTGSCQAFGGGRSTCQ